MKAAVTGGAGFIGHHLVGGLLARGHQASVIDDFSSGARSRLDPYLDRVTVTEGSVLDPLALDEALAGCEVVLHHAAIASVARSLAEPRRTNDVNVDGTIEVMLAAARHGVRRVVLAGSSAVYGPGQDPASEYAAVVPRFIRAILDGERPVFNGRGDISRDFVFVDDVVEANVRASGASAPSGLTCNIAGGTPTSFRDLLAAVGAAAGRAVEPVIGPARPGDIAHSQADVTLARDPLAFTARIPLGEGIARMLAWFRDAPAAPPASDRP